jgi:hypothetical protein
MEITMTKTDLNTARKQLDAHAKVLKEIRGGRHASPEQKAVAEIGARLVEEAHAFITSAPGRKRQKKAKN